MADWQDLEQGWEDLASKAPEKGLLSRAGDIATGLGETALNLGTGLGAGIYGPAKALAMHAMGYGNESDVAGQKAMEDLTYQPRTELGQDFSDKTGEFVNQILMPLGAHFMTGPHPTVRPRIPTVAEATRQGIGDKIDQLSKIPTEETSGGWKDMEPVQGQQELLPSNAPQYGIDHSNNSGHWSTDQNGIPIRTDLSIEAQQLQDPLQRNLWGDELGPAQGAERSLTEAMDQSPESIQQANMTQSVESSPELNAAVNANDPNLPQVELPQSDAISFVGYGSKQRGGIDIKNITDSLSNLISKVIPRPKDAPDTILTPRTADNIAQKADLESKSKALGINNSPYERVSTLEDALSNPGKDLPTSYARDYLKPGLEGTIRGTPGNRVVKYARDVFLQSRNTAEKFSRDYVTGPEGLNKIYRGLNKNEFNDVAEAITSASRNKHQLSLEEMKSLGLNEKQISFMNRFKESMDGMFKLANDALAKSGLAPMDQHTGYFPQMFSGAYSSLAGHTKDGRFIVKAIAQGDTKWQHKAALGWVKSQGYDTVIHLPRKGLKDTTYKSNNVFNGFNDLIRELAKNNPDIAASKALVDQHIKQSTNRLYNFNMHEKPKTGVIGNLGERPWLTRDQNSRQFLEAMINYIEEGSRVYAYQHPLNELGSLRNNPDLMGTHPNTLKYLDRYSKHVTGQDINPIGAASNWVIDNTLGRSLGLGWKPVAAGVRRLRNIANIHMMGAWNIGFMAQQLVQPLTGAIPEAFNIRNSLGINYRDFASSALETNRDLPLLAVNKLGISNVDVPVHMKQAWDWAQNHGIMSLSEMEQAHEVLQSRVENTALAIGNLPAQLGERGSRPPVFFSFVNLFHKAGFDGEDLMMRAQAATDYAMGNYHPDERPMLYSTFGVLGQFMGALTTYKHNFIDQLNTRAQEGVRSKSIAALTASLGAGYLLYGVSGVPGYKEADEASQKLTGKTIRDQVGELAQGGTPLWDGFVSAKSGLDFQTRLSTSAVLPDSIMNMFSPQASDMWNIFSKAMDAAKYMDEASLREFTKAVTPSGMKGMTESVDKNNFVLNKEGQKKYEQPRTSQEESIRKYAAIRPLRERLEDENLYSDTQSRTKQLKDLKDAGERLKLAWIDKNNADQQKYIQQYIQLGGDPKTILGDKTVSKILVDSQLSERQRRQGLPKNDINSINQYEAYKQ